MSSPILNENSCDTEMADHAKVNSSRVKNDEEKCDGRHDFYMEKFDEQRKINLEIMRKLNLLTNNHESLLKLVSEQTQSFKIIISGLMKTSNEMDKLKSQLKDVTEQVIDLLYAEFDE